jgi:glyoxylase-like metal-dependent hydrolase (beta-lactamase superfamily II)
VSTPASLAPGLWRWTARHPDWHPGAFGAEVASFAATTADDELLLIDPLLPEQDGENAVLDHLDALAATARAVHILITIPYHVRSAEPLGDRYPGKVRIWGPPRTAGRLRDTSRFSALQPAAPGPAGVQVFPIGRPQRGERPLWLPSHAALAFGDAIVTTPGGELRMWAQTTLDDARLTWYRERFAPTLAPLRDLPAQRILVTHGAPVLTGGAVALASAIDAPPWYHHG